MNVLICNMTQIIDVNEKSLFGYHNFTFYKKIFDTIIYICFQVSTGHRTKLDFINIYSKTTKQFKKYSNMI